MSDLISRKDLGAAIDNWLAIDRYYHPYSKQKTIPVSELVDIIKLLPSAQRKGKWIYLNGLDAFECSVCGRQMVRNIFDYCPWCGAEMTKGEEDE